MPAPALPARNAMTFSARASFQRNAGLFAIAREGCLLRWPGLMSVSVSGIPHFLLVKQKSLIFRLFSSGRVSRIFAWWTRKLSTIGNTLHGESFTDLVMKSLKMSTFIAPSKTMNCISPLLLTAEIMLHLTDLFAGTAGTGETPTGEWPRAFVLLPCGLHRVLTGEAHLLHVPARRAARDGHAVRASHVCLLSGCVESSVPASDGGLLDAALLRCGVFRHACLVAGIDLAPVLRPLRLRKRLDIDERMWIVLHAACYIMLPLFCPLQ